MFSEGSVYKRVGRERRLPEWFRSRVIVTTTIVNVITVVVVDVVVVNFRIR